MPQQRISLVLEPNDENCQHKTKKSFCESLELENDQIDVLIGIITSDELTFLSKLEEIIAEYKRIKGLDPNQIFRKNPQILVNHNSSKNYERKESDSTEIAKKYGDTCESRETESAIEMELRRVEVEKEVMNIIESKVPNENAIPQDINFFVPEEISIQEDILASEETVVPDTTMVPDEIEVPKKPIESVFNINKNCKIQTTTTENVEINDENRALKKCGTNVPIIADDGIAFSTLATRNERRAEKKTETKICESHSDDRIKDHFDDNGEIILSDDSLGTESTEDDLNDSSENSSFEVVKGSTDIYSNDMTKSSTPLNATRNEKLKNESPIENNLSKLASPRLFSKLAVKFPIQPTQKPSQVLSPLNTCSTENSSNARSGHDQSLERDATLPAGNRTDTLKEANKSKPISLIPDLKKSHWKQRKYEPKNKGDSLPTDESDKSDGDFEKIRTADKIPFYNNGNRTERKNKQNSRGVRGRKRHQMLRKAREHGSYIDSKGQEHTSK